MVTVVAQWIAVPPERTEFPVMLTVDVLTSPKK